MRIVVAIDGPAGAGKSTIAKIVADKFNLMYIDTGAMYRAVTLFSKRNNISADDVENLCTLVKSLDMHFENDELIVNGENVSKAIRNPNISNSVSLYASVSEVRELLVQSQKKMSEKYNVIMDGRDIGTVVLHDAPFKFFLTASPEVRAKRRFDELIAKNIDVNYKDILDEIIKRDFIDSTRKVNPLKKAEDALEIDTSNLNINQVADVIIDHINSKASNI